MRSESAFTLVELLVVIAVIATLTALLLPALAGAKAQVRKINCVSNQKQLAVAWMIYFGDNSDQLALNGGDTSTTSTRAHLWVYGGNHGDPQTLTNDLYLTGQNYALLASLLPTETIYKCPADRTTWPLWSATGSLVPELRSYAMNSYIGCVAAYAISPLAVNSNAYKVYRSSGQICADHADDRFLFMDVNPANICTPAFGVDMSWQRWIHYPSYFHKQRGVMVYADGHTEVHRWLDNSTMPQLPAGSGFIGHVNSAVGNRDLPWIASVTTSAK